MKRSLTCLLLLMSITSVFAQAAKPELTLKDISEQAFQPPVNKMPCGAGDSPITILSCAGEPANPNGPAGGAPMSWTATGSANLYYSEIINGSLIVPIGQVGSNDLVFPAGGNGNYTANLAIGIGTNTCLPAGTWTVRVWDVMDDGNGQPARDMNGDIIGCYDECTFLFEPSCLPDNSPAFTATVTDIGCTSTGSISLSDFDLNRFYCTDFNGFDLSYSWTGPGSFTANTTSISGLAPGSYTVVVEDFYGCTSTLTRTVGTIDPITIDCPATGTPPTTVGGTDGTADITILTGSGDYSISWTGPSTGSLVNAVDGPNLVNNLSTGTYTFIVTDDLSGCTEMCTVTIEEPPCLIDFTVMLDADGNVVITVLGGFPDFFLDYVGPTNMTAVGPIGAGGITLPASNFIPGDYDFFLYESVRPPSAPVPCEAFRDLTVPPVDCSDLTFTLEDLQAPNCGGVDDGLIEISFTGNFSPVIVWTGPGIDGDGDLLQDNLGPGTYSFEVFDSRNCSLMDSYTFTTPPALSMTCGAVGETLASRDDGLIGYLITGGTPPYTLTYTATDPGGTPLPPLADQLTASQDTLRNLQAGTYNLLITDGNGCTTTCTAEVTEPNCSLSPVCEVTNPITAGGTGSLTINLDGNPDWTVMVTGPRDSTFTTSNNSETIVGLPQGDYMVEVFNSEGCIGSCSNSIVGPTCALAFSTTTEAPSCAGGNDGAINLEITGAAPGLVIDWDNDAFDGMDTIRNLPAGSYTVMLSDQTGCPVAPQTIVVMDPAPMVVTLSQPFEIACNGDNTGFISAVVTNNVGNITYEWSVDTFPDSPMANGVAAGTYHVLATDENGCTARDTIIVDQPELLMFACSAVGESSAGSMDGSITVSFSGGGAGAGDVVRLSGDLGVHDITAGADSVFTNLGPGTYNLTVTNAAGCTDQCSAIVSQGGCDIVVTAVPTQPDCDNALGSATAQVTNPNGMVTYLWSNNSTSATITNLMPGDYSVTVTDALGCEALDEVAILPFTAFPVFNFLNATDVCDDNCVNVQFNAMGVAPFEIEFNLERAGVVLPYSFTVLAEGDGTQFLCPGDFVGVPDFRDVTLQLTRIVDDNGCAQQLTELIEIFVFPAAISTLDTTICEGRELNYFGEIFNTARTTGNVVLPIPSPNGCDSTVSVNLSFFPAALGTLDTTICVGTELNYFGEIFNAGRTTDDVVIPTPSVNGCDSTVSVNLSFFPAALGTLDTTICVGTELNYFGEIFDAGRTTDDVVVPTPSVNGCDSTVTVSLSFFPAALGTLDTTICVGTELNYFGEIFDAGRTTDDVVIPTPSVNGCDSTVTVSLSFFPAALGTLDTTICVGTELNYFGEIFDAGRTTDDVVVPTPSVNGCDSTVTVSLSFFPAALGTLDTTICVGTELNYFGEIFNAGRTTDDVVIPTPSVNGCDSTVTVSLSFFPAALGTLDTTICVGTELNYFGEIFDAGRTTDDVVIPTPSVNGCDSTVTVSLSFFPAALGTLDTTICVGTELNYFGEIFNAGRTTDDVVIPTPSVNGCDSTVTVSLSFFPAILGTLDTTICVGTELNYFGEIFNAGRTTDDVVIPTPSVNGCDSMVSVNLTFFAPAVSALDTTICAGTQLNFFGEVFDGNRTMGDVVVPTPSANGCDSTVTVNLSFFPQAAGMIDTTICAGTTFNYAGRSFSTAVNAELVTIPEPTANGCDSIVSVTVRVEEVPTVTLSGDGIICAGGELDITLNYDGLGTAMVVLSSDPGEVISIPSGTTTIQRLVAPGTSVRIDNATNDGNCPPVISGTISVQETDLRVSIDVMSGDGVFAVSCAEGSDGEVVALGEGGSEPYAFSWNTGTDGPRLEGLGAGRYNVVLTSARGCETDALVVLSSPDAMVAAIAEVPANCLDTLPSLIIRDIQGGVGPYLYRTDDGVFQTIPVFPDTLAVGVGRTNLALEDVNGCLLERSFDLEGPPSSDVVISPTQAIITQGDSVELTVITDLNIAGFLLTPGSEELIPGNSVFVGPLESTTYEIFVIDSAGCTADATVDVIIDDFVPVYAPSAFSPNGDGRNELFRIFGRSTIVSFRNFNVFNRWGHLVYALEGPIDPQDTNWGWDGRNEQGIIHEPAVYVYSIEVELADGRMVTIKSDMVLMR